uniref:MAGE domain-containing protein n=1 Tax=Caenorhabditis tropicalis TaxID=1561998 RepID=A0A1I7TKL5_9PELO
MSDDEDIQTSREEDVLSYEIFFWIVRTINEKGVVKISELRKLYQKVVAKDKSLQIRPLQELLNLVNENLLHWQGWSAVMQDDRMTYVKIDGKKSFNKAVSSETERTLGLLEIVLMYVFVSTKPNSQHPGVPHDDLMAFLESSMSIHDDQKLPQSQLDSLKKLISPSPRADFIKKGYLSFSKSMENEEEVFRYEWGVAARQTVDAVQLVKVFQKLTGMEPTQLKEQMERAKLLESEQEESIKRGAVLPTRGK